MRSLGQVEEFGRDIPDFIWPLSRRSGEYRIFALTNGLQTLNLTGTSELVL